MDTQDTIASESLTNPVYQTHEISATTIYDFANKSLMNILKQLKH